MCKCDPGSSGADSNVTPGVQEVFLCLRVFVYASSCFFLSAANNATLLFLFKEPAQAPAGHDGGREEMEGVTVRDGNIEPGEAISTLHSWCSFSLSFLWDTQTQ